MASAEQKEVEEKGSSISSFLDKAKGFFAEKLTSIPTPEATIDDVDFKGVSRQGVDYHAKVSVKNPYSQSIPICQISFILKSNARFSSHFCLSSSLYRLIYTNPFIVRIKLSLLFTCT